MRSRLRATNIKSTAAGTTVGPDYLRTGRTWNGHLSCGARSPEVVRFAHIPDRTAGRGSQCNLWLVGNLPARAIPAIDHRSSFAGSTRLSASVQRPVLQCGCNNRSEYEGQSAELFRYRVPRLSEDRTPPKPVPWKEGVDPQLVDEQTRNQEDAAGSDDRDRRGDLIPGSEAAGKILKAVCRWIRLPSAWRPLSYFRNRFFFFQYHRFGQWGIIQRRGQVLTGA